ncbi:esterase [Tersicoccus solisilvae]|uniref:Esterase n=1 Tax=Tersicoccus solisilvae TaxID=1882339 RepID=A0ABQ1PDM7_9MICC|nr:alpha/beta hydrolase fold domain-containing protein [Tersicoccus solisilvae]GGC95128.1 esterase [Tersicoccus solisilvae]
MNLDRVRPELRGPVRRLPPLGLQYPWLRRLVRWAQPRFTPGAVGDGVAVETRTTPSGVPLRVYRPLDPDTPASGPRPGLLWIHGGGLVIGDPIMDDPLCAGFVRATGAVVVSVDYRLAPERPFPAGLDDVAAGWAWFGEAAAGLGVDRGRIAVGGQSAGGGLAAALAQRLRDAEPAPERRPVAQLLLCPMLDDRTAARTELDAVRHRAWTNRQNRFGWGAYLGTTPGAPDAVVPAYAVPARRERLDGLPPAWIGVGDIDLFREEDEAYAARLADAAVRCELVIVPGAPHGFESWAADTPIAREFLARAGAWLRDALVGDPLPD